MPEATTSTPAEHGMVATLNLKELGQEAAPDAACSVLSIAGPGRAGGWATGASRRRSSSLGRVGVAIPLVAYWNVYEPKRGSRLAVETGNVSSSGPPGCGAIHRIIQDPRLGLYFRLARLQQLHGGSCPSLRSRFLRRCCIR